ncbi:MAG: GDP-L-fucose synthase [Candidatus Wallbacteria bacterium]|nr:GDP-L-fucose synthase [Candidatus Wallbacteria bacterium]
MEKQSRIYVAGHTGLAGSAIVRKLKSCGYTNLIFRTSSELDLRRQEDTERFFEQEKPEFVFLAAGKVGGIMANSTYKAEFIYDNLMIATNVIHASYKYGVKKLINLGSSCIYPKNAPQPLKEEYLLIGPLEPTNEPYAIAKIAAIKLCRYYNEQYGTNFISVMPCNLYGPNDNFDLETAHVLPAMLRKFHLAKLLSEEKYNDIIKDMWIHGNLPEEFTSPSSPTTYNLLPITQYLSRFGIFPDRVVLWGTGKPFREFLHADDLAEACVFLMEKFSAAEAGEMVNIGAGSDLPLQELAEMVKNVTGFSGRIDWDHTKPDGMQRKLLDVSRAMSLGWKAEIGFEQGCSKYDTWYTNLDF